MALIPKAGGTESIHRSPEEPGCGVTGSLVSWSAAMPEPSGEARVMLIPVGAQGMGKAGGPKLGRRRCQGRQWNEEKNRFGTSAPKTTAPL